MRAPKSMRIRVVSSTFEHVDAAGIAEKTSSWRPIANRDIHPSKRLVDAFPRLNGLLTNELISAAFEFHERAAVRWKRLYAILGRSALVCIFLVMIFFDYQFVLVGPEKVSEFFRIMATVLAAIGLASQLTIVLCRIKERWLIERFAAERLRCLKFQAFVLAACSRNSEELTSYITTFTKNGVARLDQELMGGRAALEQFSPSEARVVPHLPGNCECLDLVDEAFRAYDSMRLEVQAQHFDQHSHSSDRQAHVPALLSEATFVLGGLLALAQIFASAWQGFGSNDTIPFESWSSFMTLLLFVSSAVLAVYQRGAADAPDAERYRHYAREIRAIRLRGEPRTAQEFVRIVEDTEQIELRELFDFCRDGLRSSYIS